jgi:hypothetical protein
MLGVRSACTYPAVCAEESDDEEVKLLEQRQREEEDLDFESQYRALVKESVEVQRVSKPVSADNMALPASLPKPVAPAPAPLTHGPAVAFRLIRKDPKARFWMCSGT